MNYTTESDGYKVQANIKLGNSLQHMINIRAQDPNELCALLDQIQGSAAFIHSAINGIADDTNIAVTPQQAVQTVQQQFPQTQQIQPGVVTPYAQPQQPRTYGQPPAQERCAHGLVYELKKGVKNGKEWAGNFCAAPREGINGVPRCEPKFFG